MTLERYLRNEEMVGKTGAAGKKTVKTAISAERKKEALELRVKGHSIRAIAKILGVSTTQSHRLVDGALKDLAEENRHTATKLRAIELDRLDAMTLAIMGDAELGDNAKIDRMLKIMERRAKLLGLDTPVEEEAKQAVTVTIVAPDGADGDD